MTMMTIREALAYGRGRLLAVSPSPELDARLLLQYVLGVSQAYLIGHDDEVLTAVAQQQYTRPPGSRPHSKNRFPT